MKIAGLVLLFGLSIPFTAGADSGAPNSGAAVLKVRTVKADGGIAFGSAVAIKPGELVTNCHVTRDGRRIDVSLGDQTWPAVPLRADVERDLCMLRAPAARANIAPLGTAKDLEVGGVVFAAGYAHGGDLVISEGHIKAMHRYRGSYVIQSSAAFNSGASGGGLFDAGGRLIGILAFKARAGGDFHFALPVEWLETHLESAAPMPIDAARSAFWEDGGRRPYFLKAASLQAENDWHGVLKIAQEWAQSEPGSAEARVTASRALQNLGRRALSAPGTAQEMLGAHAAARVRVPVRTIP